MCRALLISRSCRCPALIGRQGWGASNVRAIELLYGSRYLCEAGLVKREVNIGTVARRRRLEKEAGCDVDKEKREKRDEEGERWKEKEQTGQT